MSHSPIKGHTQSLGFRVSQIKLGVPVPLFWETTIYIHILSTCTSGSHGLELGDSGVISFWQLSFTTADAVHPL